MRRAGERRPSLWQQAAERVHYWYQVTPAGISDEWSEATARAVIPQGVVERFRTEHSKVSAKGVARVEEALFQWVRIEGRNPGAHELPSYSVEALWETLRRDESDWETFRDSLGIDLDAGLDASRHWVPDDDSAQMRTTWADAFDDEVPLSGLPTLFTVDAEVGITPHAPDLPERDLPPSSGGSEEGEPDSAELGPVADPALLERAAPVEAARARAAVVRLAPKAPSLRSDGLRVVLHDRRQRKRRALLDGWAVMTANTTTPAGITASFAERFPEVGAERVAQVWDAFMQWLRIEGRKYPKKHAMPSRSVEALIGMLSSDKDAWNHLREQWPVNLDYLFVRPRGLWMPGDALEPLQVTWNDAFNDEPPRSSTPLLFRVDADVGITNARTYKAFCKSADCVPPAGVTCLHLPRWPDPAGVPYGG